MEQLSYHVEEFTRQVRVEEYVARCRDAERFEACCRECPNYGRSWCCPPFDFSVEERIGRYSDLLLVATKITPLEAGLPISSSRALIRPERVRLQRRLLELERECDGLSAAYVGSCLYCPEGSCTRPDGEPCLHPELVRPSLEAYGFDMGRTTEELFSMEMRWGRDGLMPEYLILVCGLFHNGARVEW